jgi:NAD(P)-dependent dehydrogenase (short-subunit alcohol dehydrogenase family)
VGRLDDKVAVITGAGQGIGKGIALAFAAEGATIVSLDIDPVTAAATATLVEERGVDALPVTCDIRDRSQVTAALDESIGRFGRVDILINNAIATAHGVTLEDTTDEVMALPWQTGVMGTLYCMQACLPSMRAGGGGKIVNFGSAAGLDGMVGLGSYAAAKEAIRALTKVAAKEWGQHGINVNAICPFARTEGYIGWETEHPDLAAAAARSSPLRRGPGDPEEDIGRAVLFLASRDSDFITGHTLLVDGGSCRF